MRHPEEQAWNTPVRKYMRGPVSPYLVRDHRRRRVAGGGRTLNRRPDMTDIAMVISGGGQGLIVGRYGDFVVPFNCRISQSELLADVAGSLVVDIRRTTFANFPPTAADSIVGSKPPTLNNEIKSQDNALNTWTFQLNDGDVLRWIITSITTPITQITATLQVSRT